ncbi:MAG TPA: tripartite tricarboxylate transporter substrate binding protein [Xanthobacteraceae bacterium]|nr:tripartite tricarboxylate transporter substrate binding protein [Xanthobacteraceae bacterium]
MLRMLGLLTVIALSASAVHAEEWPTRPIHVIVGAGPGGGTDIVTRIIGQPLSELLGEPIVVENKQGPANLLAAGSLVKAAKDGYTAYMINNSHGIVGALYKNLPFDPVKDFAFVSFTGVAGLVLVTRKDFPANNVKELIAAARAAPGKLNFASVGNGTTQHFSGELFRQLAGVDVKHIPYRSTPAAVTGLLAKEVDFTFELVQPVLGQIRAGELKALAVTSPERYAALPELPTVAESGLPSFQVMSWYGLTFPADTPAPIIDKMNRALHDVLAREDIRAQLLKVGATAKSSTPDELRQHVINEIAKWDAVREKAGIEKRR